MKTAATNGVSWPESGIARANVKIDDEDQTISGWHANQLLGPEASNHFASWMAS